MKNLNDINPSPSSLLPEKENINPAPTTGLNIIEITSTIPPNLLQIIDDLTRDLNDRKEINKNYDSYINNTDDEDEQDDISHSRKMVKNSEIYNNNNNSNSNIVFIDINDSFYFDLQKRNKRYSNKRNIASIIIFTSRNTN